MVKNKGIMPANPTDIPVQRAQLKAIIKSTYAACIKPDPEGGKPFTADAIIANPVAYGEARFSWRPCLLSKIDTFLTLERLEVDAFDLDILGLLSSQCVSTDCK